MKNILLLLPAILFCLFIPSCTSTLPHSQSTDVFQTQSKFEKMRESFVFVRMNFVVTACFNDICQTEEINGTSSGFTVSGDGLIFTAGHSCHDTELDSALLYMNLQGIETNVETNFFVYSSLGKEFKDVEIIAFDTVQDMCLLKVTDPNFSKYSSPVSLSTKSLKYGEVLHNIAAPHGNFFTEGSIPIFSGQYSGVVNPYPFEGRYHTPGAIFIVSTIPAGPGSSGSPVFSGEGELIGMIVMTLTTFDSLSYIVSAKEISSFIASHS